MYYYWNKSRFGWYIAALAACAAYPVIAEGFEELTWKIKEAKLRYTQRQIQKEFERIIKSSK